MTIISHALSNLSKIKLQEDKYEQEKEQVLKELIKACKDGFVELEQFNAPLTIFINLIYQGNSIAIGSFSYPQVLFLQAKDENGIKQEYQYNILPEELIKHGAKYK